MLRVKRTIKKITSFINDSLNYKNRVKITLYHKDLYLCSLIADYINEYLAYEEGKNFYLNKNNINIALIHYKNLKINKDYSTPFKQTFVEMIKLVGFIEQRKNWLANPSQNTDKSKLEKQLISAYQNLEAVSNTFKAHAFGLHQISSDSYREVLFPIINNIEKVSEMIQLLNRDRIDPSISAINVHNSEWTNKYTTGFDILHDTSKPIKNEISFLKSFHSLTEPLQRIGHDTRKYTYPHRVRKIRFEDSKNDPRLQVADLIASCIARWNVSHNKIGEKDSFYKTIHPVLYAHISDETFVSIIIPPVEK